MAQTSKHKHTNIPFKCKKHKIIISSWKLFMLFLFHLLLFYQPKCRDEPTATVIRMTGILRRENLSWRFHLRLNTNMSDSQKINSSMFQFCTSLSSDTQPQRDGANVKNWDALSPQIQSPGQYQLCVCTWMSSDLSSVIAGSGRQRGAADQQSCSAMIYCGFTP